MMHDVLLVLGYSTDPNDPVFRARVDKAIQLYNAGAAPQVIMSGCCSDKLDIRPKRSEAACMRDYALENDLSPSIIFLEEDSVDTLGNFYFSKLNYLLPCSWYNLGIVSTPWHVWRSEWLAKKVLGPDFDITGYPSKHPDDWGKDEITRSEDYNRRLLEETKKQLDGVADGDHEGIRSFLGKLPRSIG